LESTALLHRNVKFGKIFVTIAALENVMHARKIVNLAGNNCMEFSKVANPTDSTILLWNDECR
jgi:hypothetical protein